MIVVVVVDVGKEDGWITSPELLWSLVEVDYKGRVWQFWGGARGGGVLHRREVN